MAKNPNHKLVNANTLYLAKSGGGKSQALKQNPDLVKAKRVVMWDAARDHEKHTRYADTRDGFKRLLAKALRSGKPFRVAWDGAQTQDSFEWWCSLVWRVLDGRTITTVVVEELAAVTPHPREATQWLGVLLNQGRKFGMRFHATTQRVQEISKTALEQCPIWWIGPQRAGSIDRISRFTSISSDDIANLKTLNFIVFDDAAENTFVRKSLIYH